MLPLSGRARFALVCLQLCAAIAAMAGGYGSTALFLAVGAAFVALAGRWSAVDKSSPDYLLRSAIAFGAIGVASMVVATLQLADVVHPSHGLSTLLLFLGGALSVHLAWRIDRARRRATQ